MLTSLEASNRPVQSKAGNDCCSQPPEGDEVGFTFEPIFISQLYTPSWVLRSLCRAVSPQTWPAALRTAPAGPGPSRPHLWPQDPPAAPRTLSWAVAESPARPWPSAGSPTGRSPSCAGLQWAVGRGRATVAPGGDEDAHVKHSQAESQFKCSVFFFSSLISQFCQFKC